MTTLPSPQATGEASRVLLVTSEREASRVLSRLLASVVEHGQERLQADLEEVLSKDGINLLRLRVWLDGTDQLATVAVPEALSGYEVESALAGDYDWLLQEGGRR